MDYYQNSRRSILLVTIATIIMAFWWGHYVLAPSAIKALFSGLMILSAIFFPYGLIRNNDFDKFSNIILRLLFVLGAIAIIRSVFNDKPEMHVWSNKWLTLFGNEFCSLLFFPPLFAYISTIPENVALIKNINYRYMLIGAICILSFRFPLGSLLLCLPVFVPYVNRKYKFLIGIALLQALLKATTGDNPTRAYFLTMLFALAAYLLAFVIKKKLITKIFCITCITLPLFLFIPMLFISRNMGLSFFEKSQSYLVDKVDDEELVTDTRTFLYFEMASDLTRTKSWVWGKGAFAYYYSDWFDLDVNGRFGRMSSEVPFLNFLMHGGLVYTCLYFLLLTYAVYNGLWKSNNMFVQSVAVVATGWFFCSFICDLTGARYYHMFFFMLLGCCFSKRFLSMSDDEIALLFDDGVAA